MSKIKQAPSSMNKSEFLAHFSGVYELSPWVAEQAYNVGLNSDQDSLDGLARAFIRIVDSQEADQLMVLIRNHPDLAGKAAVAGELTDESSSEQASAGINQCTVAEFDKFTRLNNNYKKKFAFPFIIAVRNSNRHKILATFEQRIDNCPEQEFKHAIAEIHKIAHFRLAELFQEGSSD